MRGLQKITKKVQNFTMPKNVRMDFRGMHARLVWANEREVEPEFIDPGVTYTTLGQKDTVVWFLKEGEVTVTYPKAKVRIRAGQWAFLRAEDGRHRFAPGSRLISLRFHLRLRGGEPLFARQRDVVRTEAECPRLMATARALVAEFARVGALEKFWVARERQTLVDNLRIEAAFMGWLGAYVEAMEAAGETATVVGERDKRVAKALILIEDHRMRDKFSESGLARQCGLSVNQLTRVFRREIGVSPFQYYEKQRLELARHALAESTLPVKEISFELGFNSSSHFSTWFADRSEMSPRNYRTRHAIETRPKK